jgi:predicted choloylglycine hydrolase
MSTEWKKKIGGTNGFMCSYIKRFLQETCNSVPATEPNFLAICCRVPYALKYSKDFNVRELTGDHSTGFKEKKVLVTCI